MSALSEEQRRSQYLADVSQENTKEQQEVRRLWIRTHHKTENRWNTAQVSDHEGLLPYSYDSITWMFIVASDLTEAQRETCNSAFSHGIAYHYMGLHIITYAFEAVKTTFLELFCTMQNTSIRVSGHVNSMNRTFIVEDYAEDEFGQWAKDEVTGEQSYRDDERSDLVVRSVSTGASDMETPSFRTFRSPVGVGARS